MVSQNSDNTTQADIYFDILVCVFLTLAILGVYWQVRHFDSSMYDDRVYVYDNPHVQDGLSLKNVKWAFTTTYFANWHPLTWISYMADISLYGMNPGKHHFTNVLWHICNSLLLFFLIKYSTSKLWASGFVAALFALHPLHVESVAWIAERKDLLSAFWGLLSIITYSYYAKNTIFKWYLIAIICFIASLLSKPMLVTLPFLLLLWDYWPLGRFKPASNRKLLMEKVPFLFLTVLSSIITVYAQQTANAMASLETVSFQLRIANALNAYISYVGKMLWPSSLAVFYPFPGNIPEWKTLGAGFLLILTSFLVLRNRRHHPYLIVGWLWYLGTLVPVIGLIQIGSQAMADRYTYLPLIGPFIILTWAGSHLRMKLQSVKGLFISIAIAILSLLILLTWKQVGYWKNDITLFQHAIDVTINNYVAHNNLGLAYSNQGNLNKAQDQFARALRIYSDYVLGNNNMGFLLAKQNKLEQATWYYLNAIRNDPHFIKAYANLAVVYEKQNRITDAIRAYEAILKLHPNHSEAHLNIGALFAQRGQPEKSIKHFKIVLRQNNSYQADAYFGLGNVFRANNLIERAIYYYSKAIQLRDDFESAHNNIGIALTSQGKIEDALTHYRRALQINPNNQKVRENIRKACKLINCGKTAKGR